MDQTNTVTILPFQPENQIEVKTLILAGLTEHWGVLDPSKNPDLNDIGSSYKDAIFLLAWQQARIIGTGALVPRPNRTAEIVRMSVAADMRRQGIATQILQELCQQAKAAGYERIVLETTETWDDAIGFYQRFGFKITHYLDGDVYFVLDLRPE
jgi:ribosomal protein S18 acetylase RimI-like enzyme